ncbi:hypothetical protein D3C85_1597040 [compost metagenome]
MAVLVLHQFPHLQAVDGTFAPVGHQDTGASDEAGLGLCLVELPLVVGEVITERAGKQGECNG